MISAGQTLLMDADDTLWENNIYFERAIASFISYLDHRVHTDEEVREHLNRTERETVVQFGYGVGSFRRSLIRCFEELTLQPITPERHQRIAAFANSIAAQQIELLPGVEEGVQQLSTRHRLVLVTKGAQAEQREKLRQSGLAPYFQEVEVLQEKHVEAYRELTRRHGWQPAHTWMVGNSPKSDINPALAAGLNAVFIPHDYTWVLEHEAVHQPSPAQVLLEFGSFRDLVSAF